MPTIVVNTAADTIADDGKMSLREAVAQAGGMAGKVDIVFDTATFYVQGASSSVAISLQSTLTIAKGNIVIDGSLFYAGNAFGLKISGGGISTNAIEVAAGATVTLRDLTVEGSSNNSNLIKAKYGSDGHNGADGLTGVPNHLSNGPYADTGPGTGLSGGHGTDGQDAPNDAEAGHDAVGAIINRGTLTLERVDIQSFKTEGGAERQGPVRRFLPCRRHRPRQERSHSLPAKVRNAVLRCRRQKARRRSGVVRGTGQPREDRRGRLCDRVTMVGG